MGWFRSYPLDVPPQGILGLYCNNEAKPSPGKGIGCMRTAAKRREWKIQHERNRIARANINREFRGEAGSRRAAEYHSRLDSLSLGTA